MAQETAVDVKQAVAIARTYLVDLFPAKDTVQLEEVEPLTNGGWGITLSFEREEKDPYGFRNMIVVQNASNQRIYKVVTVDATGDPQSVKMR